ncbi:hypothetical protein GCM10023116_16040 [Kistimonas scapharcae]|uniref:Uncharacterized domain-containing protein n=2 Tax=Kistimonas scapharcae TaxID=1036133 RepID=A0ABP8V1Z4_9GAMM
MLDAVSTMTSENTLSQLVKNADMTSTTRDLHTLYDGVSVDGISVPVEKHILNAIRALLDGQNWKCNEPGARVWVFGDGYVHIVWSQAALDIKSYLYEQKVTGIPQDPDILADILIEKGIAISNTGSGEELPLRYWKMSPACVGTNDKPLSLKMLRLASTGFIFHSEPPSPVQLHDSKPNTKKDNNPVKIDRSHIPDQSPNTSPPLDREKNPFAHVVQILSQAKEPSEPAKDDNSVSVVPAGNGTNVSGDVVDPVDNGKKITDQKSEPKPLPDIYHEFVGLGGYWKVIAELALSDPMAFLLQEDGCFSRYPNIVERINKDQSALVTLKELGELGWLKSNPENAALYTHKRKLSDSNPNHRYVMFMGKVRSGIEAIAGLKSPVHEKTVKQGSCTSPTPAIEPDTKAKNPLYARLVRDFLTAEQAKSLSTTNEAIAVNLKSVIKALPEIVDDLGIPRPKGRHTVIGYSRLLDKVPGLEVDTKSLLIRSEP